MDPTQLGKEKRKRFAQHDDNDSRPVKRSFVSEALSLDIPDLHPAELAALERKPKEMRTNYEEKILAKSKQPLVFTALELDIPKLQPAELAELERKPKEMRTDYEEKILAKSRIYVLSDGSDSDDETAFQAKSGAWIRQDGNHVLHPKAWIAKQAKEVEQILQKLDRRAIVNYIRKFRKDYIRSRYENEVAERVLRLVAEARIEIGYAARGERDPLYGKVPNLDTAIAKMFIKENVSQRKRSTARKRSRKKSKNKRSRSSKRRSKRK